MTVRSMTGFASSEAQCADILISIEIKSVNHRFRDFRFRLPNSMNSIEMIMRDRLTHFFNRGSFDIFVNLKKSGGIDNAIAIDWVKVKAYLSQVQTQLGSTIATQISATDLLRNEFQFELDEKQNVELKDTVLKVFEQTCKNLLKARDAEGAKLMVPMQEYLNTYSSYRDKIATAANRYKKSIEDKLNKKIEEYVAQEKIDRPRMLQEVVFYLEKLDVNEELDRIVIHLKKTQEVLGSPGETGRQLEFLLQELGRETNTIGSKSSDQDISQWVVQMKVCLEKIREQALNIE